MSLIFPTQYSGPWPRNSLHREEAMTWCLCESLLVFKSCPVSVTSSSSFLPLPSTECSHTSLLSFLQTARFILVLGPLHLLFLLPGILTSLCCFLFCIIDVSLYQCHPSTMCPPNLKSSSLKTSYYFLNCIYINLLALFSSQYLFLFEERHEQNYSSK